METTKIRIMVDQSEAIRMGKNTYGMAIIDLDPAELDVEQREAMSSCYTEHNSEDKLTLPYPQGNRFDLPRVGEATVDTAKMLLTAWSRAQQAAKIKKQQEIDAEVAHGLSLPIENYMYRNNPYSFGRWMERDYEIRNVKSDPRLAAKLAEVRVEIDKRNAQIEIDEKEYKNKKAEKERIDRAERATKEKEDAEKIARQKQQIADWVAANGTDNQKKRAALNLLPQDEVLDAMRDHVFVPLADFSRYEKLIKSDIPCECDYDQPKYHFNSGEETEATAWQFDLMEKIMNLMPGALVEIRWHRGYCETCSDSDDNDDGVVERHSIRVAVTVGDFSFSREYAA